MRRHKLRIIILVSIMLIAALSVFVTASAKGPSPYAKLKLFAHVLSLIERNYIEDVEGEVLLDGAIKGMVRTLDPHSSFFTPEEYRSLIENMEGEFGGVGLEVGIRDDILTVLSPIPDTPAARAGIEPGDQIIAIEGRPTNNMTIADSVVIMRGKAGTSVTVTFVRPGEQDPFDVTLVREIVVVQSIKEEIIDRHYALIQVRSFQEGTTEELRASIEDLSEKVGNLKGVLLDLRRNPGGLLREAIRTADLFLDSGVLLETRGRDGVVLRKYKASRRGTYSDLPLVVLIDAGSASASEIVAGALRDHGRALLVGIRTFGKGSVQTTVDLPRGYGLKLTIAKYYTPGGHSIQAEGIVPDVIIESRLPPEPDTENKTISSAFESALPGHLAGDGNSGNGPEESIKIVDFQVRVAFQLLKGLARSRSNL